MSRLQIYGVVNLSCILFAQHSVIFIAVMILDDGLYKPERICQEVHIPVNFLITIMNKIKLQILV